MIIRRQSLVSSLVLAAALILAPLQQGYALTADEMFAEGNRLSRDDLYWAALLRYEQALEAGMNSAVLYYNIGVTHYKAGQHERARAALLKALQSPRLRVVTQYNLGLNEYAAGDTEKALEYFGKWMQQGGVPDRNQSWTLAVLYQQMDRFGDALPWAEKVLAADGANADRSVYDFLIFLYDKTGDFAKKA